MDRREFLKGSVSAATALALSGCAGSLVSSGPGARATQEAHVNQVKGMDFVCYCGLYCGLCEWHARIPQRAAALRESLAKAECRDPQDFLLQLERLSKEDSGKSCRSGRCGDKACAIRKCAIRKEVRVCPECVDYPCPRINTLARSEATLIHDGQRMKKIGLEAWLAEQEERRRAGFCYADVRCLPCEIPRE